MERNSKKTTSPPHVSISLVPFWCKSKNRFEWKPAVHEVAAKNNISPINAKCKVDYSEEEKDGKIWTVDVLFFI
ncbi:hypothetical protein GBA52_012344 [Prunus armeniaca]|nr:hypothetical protein GBA52_012344 [Prunus armeniaca]